MNEVKITTKACPSCHVLTPPEYQVKRVSRSGGKQTISFRCKSCDDKGKKTKRI
jgi:hypothetical protein